MNIKEITVGLSGVIPLASYENSRPSFSMTMEIGPGDDHAEAMEYCRSYLHALMDQEIAKGKIEYIKRAYESFRTYKHNGKEYFSVTTILYWDAEWRVTPDHLAQLAARGTIVGDMVETYLQKHYWLEPEQTDYLRDDVAVLKTGSSGLSWDDCSHKAFCEKYGDDIKVERTQGVVYNDEHSYAGTYDILGTYKGKKALMDVKCGGYNFAQLAAYAVCCPGVEQLVVLPVGPTDNKCGYQQPKVTDDIKGQFEKFLDAREKFRKRFGV